MSDLGAERSYEAAVARVPFSLELATVTGLVETALADLDAEVVRLDRLETTPDAAYPSPGSSVRLELVTERRVRRRVRTRRVLRVIEDARRADASPAVAVYGVGDSALRFSLDPESSGPAPDPSRVSTLDPGRVVAVALEAWAPGERARRFVSSEDLLAGAGVVRAASARLESLAPSLGDGRGGDPVTRLIHGLRASGVETSLAYSLAPELSRLVSLVESSPARRTVPLAFVSDLASGAPIEWVLRRLVAADG